ncbi:MAG: HAMP domain-containing histidine kinase [Bacteroidales bacterium]|nr:HAMP domain-containing histidine kinase [Bacteroidales bacterium]
MMNRKVFISIIVIMTISLVGLMVIQSFWIKNAITVKEAGFVRSVNDAISIVVYKLERIEAANQFEKQMDYTNQRQNWLQSIDSLNQSFFQGNSSFSNPMDLNKFLRKSFLAQEVLESMIYGYNNIPIENRLSISLLDSLISYELRNKGINTNFEFGIFSPSRNIMPIQKTGKYPKELLNKGFSFAMFPSDMFNNPDYLMVYFPQEKRFLIKQLWGMLSISILFIIVIILSFAYTIITILKQKKISELKNDFINNMTHEFKTPVSTISLACEALSDKDIIKSETLYDNYINVISEENKRLGGMAERILQSASLEKGQIILKKEQVDTHEIIDEAISNIKLQVEKKSGCITTDLKAKSYIIEADRVHFTNVIYNLLDNANKYTPVVPQITITTENSYSGIIISVKDNGVGISKANQKRIFEKLYRIPTGNIHNVKGFGLGLSYVKSIVEQHEGNISLESELNKGTKFIIFLPLIKK